MLHGWGHSHLMLKPLGELLAEDREVHLIDLPGFGESPLPDTVWGTRDYAERMLAYIDEQKLGTVDLLGHSFGGRISLQIASMAPDRVGKLVLINSAGIKRTLPAAKRLRISLIRWLGRVTKIIDKATRLNLYTKKFAPAFGSADYRNAGPLRPILVRTVNEDLTEQVKKVKAPTLLVWGEKDTETPTEIGARLHRLIAGSRFLVLPGRGHTPFLDAGSHLCAYHIHPFLRQGDA